MKASQLKDLFNKYEYALLESPSQSAVLFGCDCGCGGDSYTAESWREAEDSLDEAIFELKEALKQLNVYWDLPQ